ARGVAAAYGCARAGDREQPPPQPLDRLRLRRSRRDRRGREPRRRGGRPHRRGDVRVLPQRTGDARPRSLDPYVRRAEDLELPPVAARLRRARLRGHALARLRRGAPPRRPRRLRQPQAPLRRQVVGLLLSRVAVAVVGLPLVLLIAYAGGWWLFALAAVAPVLAVHGYG